MFTDLFQFIGHDANYEHGGTYLLTLFMDDIPTIKIQPSNAVMKYDTWELFLDNWRRV